MSRRFVIAVFALFLAFTWSLVQDVPQATAEDEPLGGLYGGDFVVAVPQDALFTLDPTGDPDETSEHIIDLLYDPLARIHPDNLLPIPWVASSWTVDEANGTVLVSLRDDVTWHDGTPVSADDVIYTYSADYSVTKVSDTQVFFNLSASDDGGIFLTKGLTRPLIKNGEADPVEGCGPFLYISHNGTEVVVEAYDGYFDGRPYLDSMTFRKSGRFSDETDETANDIITGGLGLIGWPLSLTESSVLLNITNATIINAVSVVPNPSLTFLYVGINTNTQRSPLNETVMRKAIAMITDKELCLTLEKNTIIADSVINPANSFWLNASVPMYRVKNKVEDGTSKADLDAVKVMLDESGYTDQDSDGFREMPDGREFSFELLYPSSDIEIGKSTIASNLLIRLQLIGLDARGRPMDTWEDLELEVQFGNFDVFMHVLDARRDPSFMREILHSASPENYVGYQNSALDEILEDADAEISMTVRQNLVRDAQGWIAEDNPLIPLLHYEVQEAVNRTTYTGWVNMVEGVYNFWSFRNLHLTQSDPPRVSVIILADQISSGEVLNVRVEVRHPETFEAMEGVYVTVTESLDPDTSYTEYTDGNGSFEFTWTAPVLTEPDTAIFSARAITPGFPEGVAKGEITIHPGAGVLRVEMTINPKRMSSGDTATVSITVRDWETLALVEGAEINLWMSPEGLDGGLSSTSGTTDANGAFQTTFTASVTVDTTFLVIGEVSKTGYSGGGDQTAVLVDRSGGTPPPIPGLDAVSIVLMLIAVTLGYAYMRRPRRN
ncbi:MAG: hypothetical protein KAS60_01205 [Thermoplasmata archaeon]|nr:ABC transporter substrate-binding protein [Candidatus Thermoplasmatota archaeon]MCK4948696.1 hypothetical protein [Thermoplasmata archaeon]